MNTFKRIGIGLSIIAALFVGLSFAHKISAATYTFTADELLQVQKSGDYFFKDGTGLKTIVVMIPYKNGSKVPVEFNLATGSFRGQQTPSIGNDYVYQNTSDFCNPGPGITTSTYVLNVNPLGPTSQLVVHFNSLSPGSNAATVLSSDTNNFYSGMWPWVGSNGTANLSNVPNCGYTQSSSSARIKTYTYVSIGNPQVAIKSAAGVGANITDTAVNNATYTYVKPGVIRMNFQTPYPKDTSGKDIQYIDFVDTDPADGSWTYKSDKAFCNNSDLTGNTGTITISDGLSPGKSSIAATLDAWSVGSGGCQPIKGKSISADNPSGSIGRIAQETFSWQGTYIQSMTCSQGSKDCAYNGWKACSSLTQSCNSANQSDTDYRKSYSGGCPIDKIILDSGGGNTGTFTRYNSNCTGNDPIEPGRKVAILGTFNQVTPPPGGTGQCDPTTNSGCTCTYDPASGVVCTDTSTTVSGRSPDLSKCYKNDPLGLGWLICPTIGYIDMGISAFDGVIQNALGFNRVRYLCAPGSSPGTQVETCTGSDTYNGWSQFRKIATALTVIIMLVMIISQALSIGPFDAYTVKKVMPRLIAAVIAMQVSWSLCAWLIQLANDAGYGIAGIFYSIFNGGNPITLATLIGGQNDYIFTDFLIAGGIIAVASILLIFTALALAVPVLISVLVAMFVLVFRKILILMCVILSPIALVAWVLPGTQRYWKLWWETFSKMLIMFPLIMLLIVGGRTFAKIAGQTQTNGTGFNASLDIFIILLVGYFGPYFMLPQTFKWGGSLLGSVGNAANKFGKKAGERPQKFFQGRQKELSAERQRKSAERVMNNEGLNWKRPWRLPIDKVRSGQWDPTHGLRGSDRRARAVGAYKATGLGVEDEAIKAEVAGVEGSIRGMARGDAISHLESQFQSANESKRQAILTKLGELQAGDALTRVRDEMLTSGRGAEWNRAVQRNYSQFKSTSPHLANGVSAAMMSANGGRGRTFTASEDAGQMAGQSRQFQSTVSGDGWGHWFDVDPTAASTALADIDGDPELRGNLTPAAANRETRRTRLLTTGTINWTDSSGAQQTTTFDQMVQQRHGGDYSQVDRHELFDAHHANHPAATQELQRRGLIP